MRLLSFQIQNHQTFGAVVDDGIVDLGKRLRHFSDLKTLIERNGEPQARDEICGANADFALSDVVFLPPIPSPGKILCVGVNYPDRNEEYRDGSERPRRPSIFVRFPFSLVGHEQDIVRPRESDKLDYEGEIVIVVGRQGRRIPEADAEQHIAGFTLMNEGTLRDWTRHGKFNVTQGKNFDRSGSIGPWMVTSDVIRSYADLHLQTRVNGEIRQNDTTANLLFPIRFLVSYISTFTTLIPGDLIATGTPPGAGARFEPPRYLMPGDIVEIESPEIGLLRNTIVAETQY